jgi:L-lactate dehydrogenase (FMN-dependent) related alpha-hydroxy acid dehydrogenase
MSGTESPDVSTPVSGIPPSMSVIMSRPVHDPKYAGAEKETAAGVAAAKTVMSVGTYTNGTIPDIAVVGQGAPQLVQLCVRKDDAFNRRICDEAEKTAPKRPALPLMPPLTAM